MGKFHRISDRREVERDGCGKRRLKWNDPQDWLVFEYAHEALVDRDSFDRAQRILEQVYVEVAGQRIGHHVRPPRTALGQGSRQNFLPHLPVCLNALGVAGIFAGVAGRAHAGRTVEGIHLQTRVVGQGQQVMQLVMGHHISLLVTRDEKIIGILRMTDAFAVNLFEKIFSPRRWWVL